MAQESVAPETLQDAHEGEHTSSKGMLGPLLCWAVVFADIGTSVYYVPGILYQNPAIGSLAGFFVFLTMSVFVLLTLKYAEVTHRFPQGGGVVTVAAQAINPWFGALGGMFILVDYFLTAAISCLSGILYFSIVFPAIGSVALLITIGVLILLGVLNWVGISESAKVSLVGAIIAFLSDLAILFTIFTHISFSQFIDLIPRMFVNHQLTIATFLTGFAGAFLAFSGLESISQLSPVMKQPHKRVAGIALLLVVLTIGITSPLLTMFSTLLLPSSAQDPVLSTQLISLLAGHWGGIFLQTEVAISASALLVFASNTAIIGAYHVFMALSRMEFLPEVILKRNKLRDTPHYSIALATGIPILILIAVQGNIALLGDMYAFGLLGAFTLTCLGLDIVRSRDWRRTKTAANTTSLSLDHSNTHSLPEHRSTNGLVASEEKPQRAITTSHDLQISSESTPDHSVLGTQTHTDSSHSEAKSLWFKIDFFLGVLTTFLVALAWSVNLVTKPLATEFGGGVALLGMGIAYFNHVRASKAGHVPVPIVVTRVEERLHNGVLAILLPDSKHNDAVIRAAINNADAQRPAMFLYIAAQPTHATAPRMMEIIDPYLDDRSAKENFGKAEALAVKHNIPTRSYVYLQGNPDIVNQVWQMVHPRDTVVPVEDSERFKDINPDRVRYELTPDGKVAHLLKRW